VVFDKKYSDEVRERAVERVLQRRREEPDNRAIVREVSEEFEVGPQSLRKWVARFDDGSYDYDAGDSGDADGWDPSPAAAPRQRKGGRRELEAKVVELEHRIAVLQEDNRSLTRVVALLADELRTTTTRAVQHPEAPNGDAARS
jgi:transposase